MKPEEVILHLKDLQNMKDVERAHSQADQLILDFLDSLGYYKIVEEFNKIEKWYA